MLFLVIGALIILSGALGYSYYLDHKKPSGLQIDIGKEGLSIEQK